MADIQKFEHNGQEFKVRIDLSDKTYRVKVFCHDEQVSPEYSVNIETHQDYFAQHKESLINQLVNLAKIDIEKDMYYKA